MALSQEDVQAIAEYARIALEGDELTQMTDYLNSAVEMLEPIREFAGSCDPTFHPIGDLVNVMRPDQVRESLTIEEALYNAASTQGRYFRVPAILPGTDEGGM